MESESKESKLTTSQITEVTSIIEQEKDNLDAFLFYVYSFIIRSIDDGVLVKKKNNGSINR